MEYYHMTKNKYVRQIRKEGLQPLNGEQSKIIGDTKKCVFYSQGKEGAIVMYLAFRKKYEDLKGERGNELLKMYKDYLDGKLELSKEASIILTNRVKQIEAIRCTENFRDYYEEGPYFSIQNLKVEEIDDKQFNFANSWVTETIQPNQLQVVSLRNKRNGEVTASKHDVIKYMMSQTTPGAIENMGIDDSRAEYIRRCYEENKEEIYRFARDYEVDMMSVEEYADVLENGYAKRSIELLSGRTIGQEVLKEIGNTREMETTALQIAFDNRQKSVEERRE